MQDPYPLFTKFYAICVMNFVKIFRVAAMMEREVRELGV